MIKSLRIKKIGYKVLSLIFKNGISVSINKTQLKLPVNYFRLFPKDYEKDNFDFIKENVHLGDVVLDIGAHIGLMAALFGKMVKRDGRVFSFEPTPGSFATLRETIRINKLIEIVTPVNMPVTERSGVVNFFISNNDIDVANTLTPWEKNKNLTTIQLQATSIDDFVNSKKLEKVDFIKIDAEGAELKVLRGGVQTFRAFKPKVNLALHPEAIDANNDSLATIYKFIKDVGYRVYFSDKEVDEASFCEKKQLFDVHLCN